MRIDSAFDFRTDARGTDPDSQSEMFRRYHRYLRSKPLPGARVFKLMDTVRGMYLSHRADPVVHRGTTLM